MEITRTLLIFVLALAGSVSCSIIPAGQTDCGFQATFAKPDGGNDVKIRFQRVTAESLGGETNCGFGFVPTRIPNVQINGSVMPEKGGESTDLYRDGDYYYEAPSSFDPQKDIIRVDYYGKVYSSDPKSVKESSGSYFVPLRR